MLRVRCKLQTTRDLEPGFWVKLEEFQTEMGDEEMPYYPTGGRDEPQYSVSVLDCLLEYSQWY
jgi:hypothetical protein